MDTGKLTTRQARFVANMLGGMSQRDAAIGAGYSPKSADAQATELLKLSKVSAAISEGLSRRLERVELREDDVIRELLRMAMSDVGEAFDADGRLKKLEDMPIGLRRAISAIEVDEITSGSGQNAVVIGHTKKVRFWPKDRALEMLGKKLKMFVDVHEHHLGKGLADDIRKARERASRR